MLFRSTLSAATTAFVTITDDDTGLSFSSPVYVVSESGSASLSLSVLRPNGTNTVTTVNYSTANGTAIAGTARAVTRNRVRIDIAGSRGKFLRRA